MLSIFLIIVVLFATLLIIVTFLEKRGTEPSPEKVQRLSRWLTPLFQSDHRGLALLRDHGFFALSKSRFAEVRLRRLLSGIDTP